MLFELPDGRVDQSVSPLEVVKFARKPLIRWSHAEAQERLAAFARKYVPAELLEQCLGELNRPGTATADWARKVAVAVYAARIRFGEEAVLEFIEDIAKHFMGDAITFAGQRFYAECFALHGTLARDHFVEHSPHLRTALFYRPHGNLFYDSLAEYFPERTRRLKLGTAWTARRLARHNGMLFSHPGGTAKDYEAAILNSTPFSDYYEAAR